MYRAAGILSLIVLTACGGTTGTSDDSPAAGSNRPPTVAATEEEAFGDATEVPSPEPTVDEAGPLAFGETFEYVDGLEVTVGAPESYSPTDSAFGQEGFPSAVAFSVTIVNGTGANFDPSLFTTTLQSANAEGSEIYDTPALEGSPSTTLLPGRETNFRIGYAVQDPADLVLEVAPSFEHDSAIFTTEAAPA